MQELKALLFDSHRATTSDGPGMRTTLFFKGCPLHCQWCHNPEGINPNIETTWLMNKCIGCHTCTSVCPQHAVEFRDTGLYINHNLCNNCYKCVLECPAHALKNEGEYWDLQSLEKEALKDEDFMRQFSGGVTVSGGEPILQYKFLVEFFKKLKNRSINTALDTSGYAKWEYYEKVYPYVDVFLYDLKLINDSDHIKMTGVSNKLILDNIKKLAERLRKDSSKKLWIRTPLIPHATATEQNINGIGKFIKENLIDVVECWELCSFNNVCKDKYKKLHINWIFENEPLMKASEVKTFLNIAKGQVGEVAMTSGLTAKEE